ncbi:nitrile hydratase accessory protein [Streptomyces sp. NPDC056653]|uniref:nitrile hydratase accessory protein n=1 Tax=Streptomyces sp. NPDC056653 TaxID=3345894 RepID=UPI003681245F
MLPERPAGTEHLSEEELVALVTREAMVGVAKGGDAVSAPLDIEGPAAPPRSNGELVFAEPWESRAFGMAVGLYEAGAFTWLEFQDALIARIAAWEAAATPDEPYNYYQLWLAALEDVLAGLCAVTTGEVTARTHTLAQRPRATTTTTTTTRTPTDLQCASRPAAPLRPSGRCSFQALNRPGPHRASRDAAVPRHRRIRAAALQPSLPQMCVNRGQRHRRSVSLLQQIGARSCPAPLRAPRAQRRLVYCGRDCPCGCRPCATQLRLRMPLPPALPEGRRSSLAASQIRAYTR